MKTVQKFGQQIFGSSLILFAASLFQCSTFYKQVSDSCRQASLETWTDVFISHMNSGSLPDDANKIAESVSAEALNLCMQERN